uniref:Uncharacterized protein n=1 Tax=Amphimedon queenslandica TaxID=400682 RepID=A0A1X7THD7_AMPQE
MCSRRLGAQNVTKSYQYCSWWWTKLWMLYLEMLVLNRIIIHEMIYFIMLLMFRIAVPRNFFNCS